MIQWRLIRIPLRPIGPIGSVGPNPLRSIHLYTALRFHSSTGKPSDHATTPKSEAHTHHASDDVQERLSKILADAPYSQSLKQASPSDDAKDVHEVDMPNSDKSSSTTSTTGNQTNTAPSTSDTNSNARKTYTYADIFNIQQIIDTVRASENVKLLTSELSTFYENKKKSQQEFNDSLSKKIDHNVKELKSSISIASKVVNEITGYNKVIKLKDIIDANERKLQELKAELHKSKQDHERALELRSTSQKEVNELLERKNSWTPMDLERFTKIYMTTHDLEKNVKDTSKRLHTLETLQESTHDALIRSIMNRYHEEQVWSDKIRQFSTWGTILIMCINLLLVFLVQVVFEPFKRWRLVNSFEGKVKELFSNSEKLDLDIQQLREELAAMKSVPPSVVDVEPIDMTEPPTSKAEAEAEAEVEPVQPMEPAEPIELTPEPLAPAQLPPFRVFHNGKLDMDTIRLYAAHYYHVATANIVLFLHKCEWRFKSVEQQVVSQPLSTTLSSLVSTVLGSHIFYVAAGAVAATLLS